MVEPCLPSPAKRGCPGKFDLREVFNAIQYMRDTGCRWQALPPCFPPSATVQQYFHLWRRDGIFIRMNDKRRKDYRKRKNPLRLAVLSWVKCKYCRMREESPKVAEAFLHGNISFNDENLEFVKTYPDETGNAPNGRSLRRTIADYTRNSIFEFGSAA